MQSPDHPELAFVQAAGYTKGRPDGPPLWIVVHDMEASETTTRAETTAAYFANPGDGREVSSHYCADTNSVVQCVRLGDVAWTVGNRPGNYRGINWELAGYANQTREQWLDAYGLAMFRQAAPIIRADAAKFGIPLRRCSVDDLKALRPGITSHNDLRLAFGGTTHTDPGPNFPWDQFMKIITGEDMTAKDLLAEDVVPNRAWRPDVKTNPTVRWEFAVVDTWDLAYQASKDAAAARKTATELAAGLAAVKTTLAQLAEQPATAVTDEQLERVLRKVLGSVDGATP